MVVVLCWYDFPAAPASATALVNDLDLAVGVGKPGGGGVPRQVLGNNLEGAASPSPDRANTVERVLLAAPAAGSPLTVTVSTARLGSAGLAGADPDALLPQRWAVVVVGHVAGTLDTQLNPALVQEQKTAAETVSSTLAGCKLQRRRADGAIRGCLA